MGSGRTSTLRLNADRFSYVETSFTAPGHSFDTAWRFSTLLPRPEKSGVSGGNGSVCVFLLQPKRPHGVPPKPAGPEPVQH